MEVCACVCTWADGCGRTGVIRGSRERRSSRANQEPVRKELNTVNNLSKSNGELGKSFKEGAGMIDE